MHEITEAVSRVMAESIREHRETLALNMDNCFGEVMDSTVCSRCQTSSFEPKNDFLILS